MVFFEDRYDEAEIQKLYDAYRGKYYFRARSYWEPWYSEKFNSELGGNSDILQRHKVYIKTLEVNVGEAQIKTVLDYGGDRGQMMIGGPGKEHYVFDISGTEPEHGVIALDEKAMDGRQFDLVLLCEVLEHVSNPVELIRNVTKYVKDWGYLYITVPKQEFQFSDIPAGTWYHRYLSFILNWRWSLLLSDFWSTGFRVKFGRIPRSVSSKCMNT
jgi:SAM-dependent methyltransferase